MSNEYSATLERTLGAETEIMGEQGVQVYRFQGRGLRGGRSIAVWRSYDADNILALIALAFEAGREDKAAEVRKVLGAKGNS